MCSIRHFDCFIRSQWRNISHRACATASRRAASQTPASRRTPDRDPELFWATVGGMGLTGHVLEVELQMTSVPSPWIRQETQRVDDIEAEPASVTGRSTPDIDGCRAAVVHST